MPSQYQVGVQHREQLTRSASRLPPQRHANGDTAPDRLHQAHPDQLGQPPRTAKRSDAQHGRESFLVRGFGRSVYGAPVDQVSQPRGGHIEPGLEYDLLGGEHPPTVLAPSPPTQGQKSPSALAELRTPAGGQTERDTSRTRQPDTVLSSAVTLLTVRRERRSRHARPRSTQEILPAPRNHHPAIRHFPLPTNVFRPADRSTDYLVDGPQNRADMCIGADYRRWILVAFQR